MRCGEIDELLIAGQAGAQLPPEARRHIESCVSCLALLHAGDGGGEAVNPAVLDRVRTSIVSTVAPVRPLAPAGVFAAGFIAIFAAIAAAGATRFGARGVLALMPAERIVIFGALLAVAAVAALSTARGMRPGVRNVSGGVVAVGALLTMEAVFLGLFHDYTVRRFAAAGMPCLKAGLLCALPAGVLMWVVVRRGFVIAPASTGAAAGALAGATGLAMLELHCPVLTAPHVAVWHTAVLAAMIGAGALAGWIARARQKPA